MKTFEISLTKEQKQIFNKFISVGINGMDNLQELFEVALFIPNTIDDYNLLIAKFMKRTSELAREHERSKYICLESSEYAMLTDVVSSLKAVTKQNSKIREELKQELENADMVIKKHRDKYGELFRKKSTTIWNKLI